MLKQILIISMVGSLHASDYHALIGFLDPENISQMANGIARETNTEKNLSENGIFTKASVWGSNQLFLNLSKAQEQFHKFDLHNRYSHDELLNFKKTCESSMPQRRYGDKHLKKSIVVSPDWFMIDQFHDHIKYNKSGAENRSKIIPADIKEIKKNHITSWNSIFMPASICFGMLGGLILINPFLPSNLQAHTDGFKEAAVVIGATIAPMIFRKTYQDYRLNQLDKEVEAIKQTIQAADRLLPIINSFKPVRQEPRIIDKKRSFNAES